MAWVEGEPLSEFAGLLPILAEDFQETMAPMVDGAVRAQALVCGALKRAFAQVA